MKRAVLIVEDSETFAGILTAQLQKRLSMTVVWANSLAEAERILAETEDGAFCFALLDLHLPDAPKGEVVDRVLATGIPAAVFTGDFSHEAQEFVWKRPIVDYVLKEGPQSIEYVVDMIDRFLKNQGLEVLVVDDSPTTRSYTRRLLEIHRYKVLEAEDGKTALDILRQRPGIKLAIVDYQLPGMTGFELTKNIRVTHGMDRLAVIGVSAQEDPSLSVRFMKYGANDFLTKPFLAEQLFCRVTQNIDLVQLFSQIKEYFYVDYLTRMPNRHYFFEFGATAFRNARRRGQSIVVGMIDVDYFKRVNDTYGHRLGDQVLAAMAHELNDFFAGEHIIARFGGEEFCALVFGKDRDEATAFFETLRRRVSELKVPVNDTDILSVTVSIGLSDNNVDSLDQLVSRADENLYVAKRLGRDCIAGP